MVAGLHRRTSSAALHSYSSIPVGDQDISLFSSSAATTVGSSGSHRSTTTTGGSRPHSVSVTVPPEMLEELEEKEGLLAGSPRLHPSSSSSSSSPRSTQRKRSKCKVIFLLMTLSSATILTYALVTGWIAKRDVERVWGDWREWTVQQQANWAHASSNDTTSDSVESLLTSKGGKSNKVVSSFSIDSLHPSATNSAKLALASSSSTKFKSNMTYGYFTESRMEEVNDQLDNGNLSSYRWHDTLPSLRQTSSSLHQGSQTGRLIAVGDLHGTHRSLFRLLRRIHYSPSHDTLVHTGDILAKSSLENSLTTLRLLRKLGARGVRGNHDQKVIEWRRWMESLGPLDQSSTGPGAEEEEGEEEEEEASAGKVHETIGNVFQVGSSTGRDGGARVRPAWGGFAKGSQGKIVREEEEEAKRQASERRMMKPRMKKSKRDWLSWLSPGNDEGVEQTGYDSEVEETEDLDSSTNYDEADDERFASARTKEGSNPSSVSPSSAKSSTGAYRRPFGQRPTRSVGAVHSSASTASASRPHSTSRVSSLKSASAHTNTTLLGPLYAHLDPKLTRSERTALGLIVPTGWEWGSQHFEIARHLSKEDVEYLENLPLTLWIEELNSFVVHAGLVPSPESQSLSSLSTLPTSLASTSPLTFTPPSSLYKTLSSSLRGSLLLTPQNTEPFTLLNMRTLSLVHASHLNDDDEGGRRKKIKGPASEWKVSSKSRKAGKNSQPWWSVWETSMDKIEQVEIVREEEIKEEKGSFGVVYGHWASQGLQVQKYSVGLDSGCVYGRQLSALVLDLSSSSSNSSPLEDPKSISGKSSSSPSSSRINSIISSASSSSSSSSNSSSSSPSKEYLTTTGSNSRLDGGKLNRISKGSISSSDSKSGEEVVPLSSSSSSSSSRYQTSSTSTEEEEEVEEKPWWKPWKRSLDDAEGDSEEDFEIESDDVERRLKEKRAPPQFRPDGGIDHSMELEVSTVLEDDDEDSSSSSTSTSTTTRVGKHQHHRQDHTTTTTTSSSSTSTTTTKRGGGKITSSLTPSSTGTKIVSKATSSMKPPTSRTRSSSSSSPSSMVGKFDRLASSSSTEDDNDEQEDQKETEESIVEKLKQTNTPEDEELTSTGYQPSEPTYSARQIKFSPLLFTTSTSSSKEEQQKKNVWIVSVDCGIEVEMDTE